MVRAEGGEQDCILHRTGTTHKEHHVALADAKIVEQVHPDATNLIIKVEATQIAALVKEPPRWLSGIDKTMIIINGDIFEHLPLEAMCPTWLYDEMARTDKVPCGSHTVVCEYV